MLDTLERVAGGYIRGQLTLSIMIGFLIFALVLTAMMGTFLGYFGGVMHDLTPR